MVMCHFIDNIQEFNETIIFFLLNTLFANFIINIENNLALSYNSGKIRKRKKTLFNNTTAKYELYLKNESCAVNLQTVHDTEILATPVNSL